MNRLLAHPLFIFFFLFPVLGISIQRPVNAAGDCNGRSYYIPFAVSAGGVARSDKVVSLAVDFAAELSALGRAGAFSEASLCVVEVDASGGVVNTAVPFQFDNGSTPNHPQGALLFLLEGSTAADAVRYFRVYFHTTGDFTAPAFADRVALVADDQSYRGQSSLVIETRDPDGVTANAVYYYHKTGAGFASLYDRDGKDWISYYPAAGSKSGGEYRGVPNLGKVFHPGYSAASGSNQGSTTTALEDGPLRLTIQSVSLDGQWEAQWHIYPTYAQMELVRRPANETYWFLYEGTPGGRFDYSGGVVDTMVTSGNVTVLANQTHSADLSPEWVYFADGVIDRSFFMAHSNDDGHVDSFRRQDDFPGSGGDADAMTVFGFGREGNSRLLDAPTAVLTIGLIDTRAFAAASAAINNAYREVQIIINNEAPRVVVNNGLAVMEGETAVLTPAHLAAVDPEGGVVTYAVTLPPAHGALLLDGAPLQANDTFTQEAIDGGALAYAHDGSKTLSDGFAFSISDGVHTAGAPLTITITARPRQYVFLPLVERP